MDQTTMQTNTYQIDKSTSKMPENDCRKWLDSGTKHALSYCTTSGMLMAMHILFLFNYARIYLNVFELPDKYFLASHCVLLVSSQLVLAFVRKLQCSQYFRSAPATPFLVGGLFYVTIFGLFWFPWGSVTMNDSPLSLIHFGVFLILYDATYTCMTAAQSELFDAIVDMNIDKTNLAFNSQIARVIGSRYVTFVRIFIPTPFS